MRTQEVHCFQTALQCDRHQIEIFDLTAGVAFSNQQLQLNDLVVIGGSGNYTVADGGPWWESAADNMIKLHDISKPSFASCWGFQAMARALGGEVVTDLTRAEVGTLQISLTDAGSEDPVFGAGPMLLDAQFGHQDIVERLPDNAVCLASSVQVVNQAMMFPGKPISIQSHTDEYGSGVPHGQRAFWAYGVG